MGVFAKYFSSVLAMLAAPPVDFFLFLASIYKATIITEGYYQQMDFGHLAKVETFIASLW